MPKASATPSLRLCAAYYLLGIRLKDHPEWVRAAVEAGRWHVWVPRLRITVPVLIGIWVFAGPLNDELPRWSPFFLTGVVALMWTFPVGDGAAERRRELHHQRAGGDWFKMMLGPFMKAAESITPPDTPPSLTPETDDHEPVPQTETDTLIAICTLCSEQIQRDEERWVHKDPHWLLFECVRCGWQNAIQEPCASCGAPELVRYEVPVDRDPRLLLWTYRISMSVIATAIVYWIVTDEQVRAHLP